MRISLPSLLIVVAVLIGCSESSTTSGEKTAPIKASDPAPADKDQGDKAPADTKPADAKPADTTTTNAADALCADPCRLLTKHSLSKLDGPFYCQACGGADPGCAEGDGKYTPFAIKDQCGQQSMFRNCIYAANGYSFKKPQWQARFGKTDWYKPRSDFKEGDFSAVEKANVAALRQRESQCKAQGLGPLSNKDTEMVRAFFRKIGKGSTSALPKKLFIEGEENSRELLMRYLPKFNFNKNSRMSYSSWGPDGKFDRKNFRVIEVHEADRGPDCDSDKELCEGDELIKLLVDKRGKIRSLGMSGYAACPHVYVDSRLVGEILRNVSSPERELSQHLAVLPKGDCRASLTVEIREEKRERTFLDQVNLVVGDAVLAPATCASQTGGSLCTTDRRYHVLNEGDETTLTFHIPEAFRCQAAKLRARGYYQRIAQPL